MQDAETRALPSGKSLLVRCVRNAILAKTRVVDLHGVFLDRYLCDRRLILNNNLNRKHIYHRRVFDVESSNSSNAYPP
jgi:hypothetical protein